MYDAATEKDGGGRLGGGGAGANARKSTKDVLPVWVMLVDHGAGKRPPLWDMPVVQPWFGARTAAHHLAALSEAGPSSTGISPGLPSAVVVPDCFHAAWLSV